MGRLARIGGRMRMGNQKARRNPARRKPSGHAKNPAKNKLEKLLIPNQKKFSSLLREFIAQDVAFMNNLRDKLGAQ